MLSRHFTNSARAAAVLLALILFGGCAGIAPTTGNDRQAGDGSRLPPVARGSSGAVAAANGIPARAQTLYEQAAAAMAAGEFVEAELRFEEFVLQYPEFAGAHVNLAIIHANGGNDDAAQTAINGALAIDPDNSAALNQQGMLFRRNGKFIEAEAAYMKAVTADPGYALAHYNLGVLNELYLQRLDRALQHFEDYQALVGEDKQVAKWIKDLRRRVAAADKSANVTD
jgi:tetratricopeptide (TPR) repeat protein